MCVRRTQEVTGQSVSERVSSGSCHPTAETSLTTTRYVEMLESQQTQLVAGLQELYRRLQRGEGWVGSPLKESTRGMPLTHDILERLGALKQDSKSGLDHFEDDYEVLQNMLFANGAGAMQREHSFDTNSEADHTPTFDMGGRQRMSSYPNSFAGSHFPPTPPVGSPHPYSLKTSSPLKAEMSISSSGIISQDQWQMEPMEFTEMEYNMTYESPVNDVAQMQALAFTQMYTNAALGAINPCLTMKQWPAQDDSMQPYFTNPFT